MGLLKTYFNLRETKQWRPLGPNQLGKLGGLVHIGVCLAQAGHLLEQGSL